MKNLFEKLANYLCIKDKEILFDELCSAEVHHVTENSVSVIWKNGAEDHLQLENGKLYRKIYF